MSESWLEHLDKAWMEVKEDEAVKPLDKESVGYFMNQMTQEEFNERKNDNKKVEHEFNMIKKDLPICSGPGVYVMDDIKPPEKIYCETIDPESPPNKGYCPRKWVTKEEDKEKFPSNVKSECSYVNSGDVVTCNCDVKNEK